MSALLEIENLHAYYGKSHVLHGVDLMLHQGEIVSLLGRNGVGRSTTVKAAMGLTTATGSIRFKGEEILGLKTFEIARKGLAYVAENREIFPTLTVAQNLLLGEKKSRHTRWHADDMYRLFPRLKERRHVAAGVLSGGEQQMLALCRSLMGDPDLIMIDEPTEGLAPQMVALLADFLKQLAQRGVAVLLIEQKLAIALDISQRVYVMGHGRIVFEGTPQALRSDAVIRKEWLAI
ncbi:ABC transporter ATP-binding protein [Herminiimonas fonticola]|uniref:ABC transporter ATP-binding protein n=1 Tax=Herminiimonas fonticola TaxID=303380 RepID=UPI003342A2C2